MYQKVQHNQGNELQKTAITKNRKHNKIKQKKNKPNKIKQNKIKLK